MGLIVLAENGNRSLSWLSERLATRSDIEFLPTPAYRAAEELAVRRQPAVFVIGQDVPTDAALELADRLSRSCPDTAVIVVAPRLSTELMRMALRCGVKDVLDASQAATELQASVLSAHDEVEQRRRAKTVAYVDNTREAGLGTVVTVFSTKGGVGKSTLSTNLAVALAQNGHRTVIVDLDLQFGDVAIMMQLVPERTAYDVSQVIDRLDAEMLDGFLAQHESGARALLAPVNPEEADAITTGRIARVLELLKRMFEFVVVDTPATFNEAVLTALDRSDQVYAVATLDVPSVKNTRVSLQKLEQLGYARDLVRIVLNRADSKVWLQTAEVEKAIGRPIAARIPSDRLVPRSVNRGVPIVMDAPRSAVARSIQALAKAIGESTRKVADDVA